MQYNGHIVNFVKMLMPNVSTADNFASGRRRAILMPFLTSYIGQLLSSDGARAGVYCTDLANLLCNSSYLSSDGARAGVYCIDLATLLCNSKKEQI